MITIVFSYYLMAIYFGGLAALIYLSLNDNVRKKGLPRFFKITVICAVVAAGLGYIFLTYINVIGTVTSMVLLTALALLLALGLNWSIKKRMR